MSFLVLHDLILLLQHQTPSPTHISQFFTSNPDARAFRRRDLMSDEDLHNNAFISSISIEMYSCCQGRRRRGRFVPQRLERWWVAFSIDWFDLFVELIPKICLKMFWWRKVEMKPPLIYTFPPHRDNHGPRETAIIHRTMIISTKHLVIGLSIRRGGLAMDNLAEPTIGHWLWVYCGESGSERVALIWPLAWTMGNYPQRLFPTLPDHCQKLFPFGYIRAPIVFHCFQRNKKEIRSRIPGMDCHVHRESNFLYHDAIATSDITTWKIYDRQVSHWIESYLRRLWEIQHCAKLRSFLQ